ncbi:hypothetical protein CATYP_08635 [Corynebacterium atypicum]|uniref:Fluoride-specific ion channel FluC n=1 Tax=Corynebacterium atypicum TaxID=191610 RepID=A0ABN4DGH4_9CORY|nr:CrcB family protein [Corynebacterium atypicum]AIG64627.1 hypothetical protein CATYP_08635 [Corynebacterium atypicum]
MILHAGVILALVLCTGALGGAVRYLLARLPGGLTGTWLANILGSFAAGLAFGLDGLAHTVLAAGFAGAVSTLSTLAQELGGLIKHRHFLRFAYYLVVTIAGGLVFAELGLVLSA